MVAAIIAYLSSNQASGLSEPTARMLSNPDYHPGMRSHLKLTLAAYEIALAQNRAVIQASASRLRVTLTLLIAGIIYWTVTAASLVAGGDRASLLLLVVSTLVVIVVTLYIFTKSYMVLPPQEEDNE